jgi:hypothetical protein
MKNEYVNIFREFFLNDKVELSINCDGNLDQKLKCDISRLQDAITLLKKNRDAKDKIAT